MADRATKRRDVYAVALPAGRRLRVTVTATGADYTLTLGDPGAVPGTIDDDPRHGRRLCLIGPACEASVPIAAAGTYLLVLDAGGPGVRCTLRTSTAPLTVGAGVVDLTATAASDLPGMRIAVGQAVTSVVDPGTGPRDVYALALRAGQTLRVDVTAEAAGYDVLLLPPGAQAVARQAGRFQGTQLCVIGPICDRYAPIVPCLVSTLFVEATGPGLQDPLRTAAP